MINTSNEYKNTISNNSRQIAKATITLADRTVLDITGKDIMANTIKINDATSSESSFDIGAAIIGKFSFTLNNYDGKFDLYDFTGAKIVPFIGVPLSKTTEWLKKGNYNLEQPDSYGSTISLSALDNMSKFEKPYSEVKTVYPENLQKIVLDICAYCGVSINNTQFDNYKYVVSERPDDNALSCLDVISYVAQIAGCFARANNDGVLELKWYNASVLAAADTLDGGVFDSSNPYATGDVADGGNFIDYATGVFADAGTFIDMGDFFHLTRLSSVTVSTDDVVITGIRVTVKSQDDKKTDDSVLYGDDGYVLSVSDNPLIAYGNSKIVSDYLGDKIVGMKFRPMSCSVLSDPSMEAGDFIRLTDRKQNTYQGYITSLYYTIGNYERIKCSAKTPSRINSTSYSASTKLEEKVKDSTNKQISNYDQAVQQMNQLAANTLGFYSTNVTQEDGSIIAYRHDKPTLAESKVVYKSAIDGFFVTKDYTGDDATTVWSSGFDKDGNAVVNILSAIGINFDWARGGTLTLGGTNNGNGLLKILDADGNVTVTGDNDGITAKSFTADDYVYVDGNENSYLNIGGYLIIGKSVFEINSEIFSTSMYYVKGAFGGLVVSSSRYKDSHESGTLIGCNQIAASSDKTILTSTEPHGEVAHTEISVPLISMFKGDGTNSYFNMGTVTQISPTRISSGGEVSGRSLSISGTKSRITSTKQYADRLLYCYETPTPMFGDIGEGIIGVDGQCFIDIDPIFYETIEDNYHVFLQKYGKGDLCVHERTPTFFVVDGTPGLHFSWELKAIQKDYSMNRLEVYDPDEYSSNTEEINYGIEAINYIQQLDEEEINHEES